jgi:hypothetical protein
MPMFAVTHIAGVGCFHDEVDKVLPAELFR